MHASHHIQPAPNAESRPVDASNDSGQAADNMRNGVITTEIDRIMPIEYESHDDGMRIDIRVSGRFDYTLAKDFRGIYQGQPEGTSIDYHIDLSSTDFLDSTALGMLLLIREHAKERGGAVYIENPSENADLALRTANFEQLFRIISHAA